MNITNFFTNPIGESVAVYVNILGPYFYGIITTVIGIYILMKTESWQAAGASFIFMALLFSGILPAYIIFIWAVAVGLAFTFLIIDLLVLK
jgi:hypothetical protein